MAHAERRIEPWAVGVVGVLALGLAGPIAFFWIAVHAPPERVSSDPWRASLAQDVEERVRGSGRDTGWDVALVAERTPAGMRVELAAHHHAPSPPGRRRAAPAPRAAGARGPRRRDRARARGRPLERGGAVARARPLDARRARRRGRRLDRAQLHADGAAVSALVAETGLVPRRPALRGLRAPRRARAAECAGRARSVRELRDASARWCASTSGATDDAALVRCVEALGYRALAYDPGALERPASREARETLARLLVAAFLAGNVMVISLALYFGALGEIEPGVRRGLRWLAVALSVPAVTFCALPFWRGAIRGARRRELTLDVPVVLGVSTAFAASILGTLAETHDVYMDSASMIVFLILLGRTLERGARARASGAVERLAARAPRRALRRGADGLEEVDAAALVAGDRVVVPAGQAIPDRRAPAHRRRRDRRVAAHRRVAAGDAPRGRSGRERHAQPRGRGRDRGQRARRDGHGRAARRPARASAGAAPGDPARGRPRRVGVRAGRARGGVRDRARLGARRCERATTLRCARRRC